MHPIRYATSARSIIIVSGAIFWAACGPADSGATTNNAAGGATAGASSTGASGSAGSISGGSSGSSGSSGSPSYAGGTGAGAGGTGAGGGSSGEAGTSLAGAAASGAGSGGSGGMFAGGGSSAGSGGARADAGASSSAGGLPNGCSLPATVSFKSDVQKFLSSSCSGTGCHVIDDKSTMSSGGYDHAYDWITATSHASSCPTGAPKRFEVVLAVIAGANPSSCSKSRVMPPDPATHTPLTPCQVSTLQAWLAEPMVTQLHRADDTSPTTPYAMPPFN